MSTIEEIKSIRWKYKENFLSIINGFFYEKVRWEKSEEGDILEVEVRPRKNSKVICSVCKRPGPTYDTAKSSRRFEFIPLWGYAVVLLYRMRCVSC